MQLWLLVLLLSLAPMSGEVFALANEGEKVVCTSRECLGNVVDYVQANNGIVAAAVSLDIEKDPYLLLYLGWMVEVVKKVDRKVYWVLFNFGDNDVSYAKFHSELYYFLSILPSESIFFANQHGPGYINVKQLGALRETHGIGSSIVLHMNHEQPWKLNQIDYDYTFDSTNQLVDCYKQFALVVRNYYYEPLLASSVYFPTGPSKYHVVLGLNSTIADALASTRSRFCYFSGRRYYEEQMEHEQSNERELLFQLHETSTEFRSLCQMDSDVSLNQHAHGYEDYLSIVADTTFTLCPAGNNPETFRLYEAIELGSIPLFIRPPNSIRNYLRYGPWATYPGVIFDNIGEIVPYLRAMKDSPAKINQLQSDLRKWYQQFKEFIQDDIGKQINQVLTRLGGRSAVSGPAVSEDLSRRILKLEAEAAETKLLTKHLMEKVSNLEIFISNFMASNRLYIQQEQ